MTSVNSSFDSGVLRVCYHGKNRNRSEISKETFENCIHTMYNCPIVCNYIREDDEIGSHDVDIVKTNKGLKLINITTPVGIVPTGANYWWEEVEDNGVTHEYLCVEVLIWKRQEAYTKIKENGVTEQSMEITVKSGEMIDGYYRVYDFEFTAFCLLGTAEPCFESAALQMFTKGEFSVLYSQMLYDLKEEISEIQTAKLLHPQKYLKGGNATLEQKLELLTKYNLTVDMLDFNIEDFDLDELKNKFEEIKKHDDDDDESNNNVPDDGEGEGEGEDNSENTDEDGTGEDSTFSLSGEQFRSELWDALGTVKIISSWGEEIPRYMYVDYDVEPSEVYCYDWEDWKLYGFIYSVDGDSISIDFNSKKRKKFAIADFEEGDSEVSYAYLYENISNICEAKNRSEFSKDTQALEDKFTEATNTIDKLNSEIETLREYKECKDQEERNNLFASFKDLNGIEAFEELKNAVNEFSLSELEEKCYAIRGRKGSSTNFSTKHKVPKLPVQTNIPTDEEPYGGIFVKYNTHIEN